MAVSSILSSIEKAPCTSLGSDLYFFVATSICSCRWIYHFFFISWACHRDISGTNRPSLRAQDSRPLVGSVDCYGSEGGTLIWVRCQQFAPYLWKWLQPQMCVLVVGVKDICPLAQDHVLWLLSDAKEHQRPKNGHSVPELK